jgi:chromosomal replication initiator protein
MQAWDDFLKTQDEELGKDTSHQWLRSLKVLHFDACNLFIEACDSFQALWFEEHIRPKLARFSNNNGSPIKVHLAIRGQARPSKNKTKEESPPSFSIFFEKLDPDFTFSEFLSFPSNQMALKFLNELASSFSSQATKKPEEGLILTPNSPNPIFLYGPSGSGKTHLLQAMAAHLKALGYKTLFANASLFTDHVVRAIRQAQMVQFRNIYRVADVLIIDDVHELQKKAATQEEFFHTFNTLHTAGKLIILSANVCPQHLEFIEPRLISRFEWGISLPLSMPDKKEHATIIDERARKLGLAFHTSHTNFLVETFASSPKASIEALKTLHRRLSRQGKVGVAPPLHALKNLLTDRIELENARKVTPDKIILAVAEFYGSTADDLLGKSQNRSSSTPRKLAMYLCRSMLKLPYITIGDVFSRDHSTVMTAIKQVECALISQENELRGTILALEQKLSQNSLRKLT